MLSSQHRVPLPGGDSGSVGSGPGCVDRVRKVTAGVWLFLCGASPLEKQPRTRASKAFCMFGLFLNQQLPHATVASKIAQLCLVSLLH